MNRSRALHLLGDNRVGLVVLIVVVAAAISAAKPTFLNPQFVIGPMLTNVALYTVVGLAQMMVLAVGQMNLAVGGTAALGGFAAGAVLRDTGAPLVVGVLAGMLVGAVVGAVSGAIIAYGGVNSFIVTLAMSFALLGLVPTVYSAASTGSAITVRTPGLDTLGSGRTSDVCVGDSCGPAGIPLMLGVTVLVMTVLGVFFSASRIGREVLLTGSNDRAALLSAIPVPRRVLLVHVLSGALAALAGVLQGASNGSFTPAIGGDFMLQSFLGPILGGTLLVGGYVSVVGTLLGIGLTFVIRQGLLLFQVGIEGLNMLLGAILLLALTVDRIRTVADRRSSLRRIRRAAPPPAPPGPPAPPASAVTP